MRQIILGMTLITYLTLTFFANVLNRTPLLCTTVMVRCPVLLTFKSLTIPDFPLCVPAMTVHLSPSFSLTVSFSDMIDKFINKFFDFNFSGIRITFIFSYFHKTTFLQNSLRTEIIKCNATINRS